MTTCHLKILEACPWRVRQETGDTAGHVCIDNPKFCEIILWFILWNGYCTCHNQRNNLLGCKINSPLSLARMFLAVKEIKRDITIFFPAYYLQFVSWPQEQQSHFLCEEGLCYGTVKLAHRRFHYRIVEVPKKRGSSFHAGVTEMAVVFGAE